MHGAGIGDCMLRVVITGSVGVKTYISFPLNEVFSMPEFLLLPYSILYEGSMENTLGRRNELLFMLYGNWHCDRNLDIASLSTEPVLNCRH